MLLANFSKLSGKLNLNPVSTYSLSVCWKEKKYLDIPSEVLIDCNKAQILEMQNSTGIS